MIAASLLALAALAAPAPASAIGYSPDTMRHLKGHPSLPAPAAQPKSDAPAVCHPDPGKGRVCRHHVSQKEQARREARSAAQVAVNEASATAR